MASKLLVYYIFVETF